jgi:CBS domain-containing protein
MPAEDVLLSSKIRELEPDLALCVDPNTDVITAINLMRNHHTGCVVVCEDRRPIGVFTERDVLMKIAGEVSVRELPVKSFMTESPKTLGQDAALTDAVLVMDQGSYRHVPIVDDAGCVVGIISIQHLVTFLAELFPTEVLNLPPHPHQHIANRDGG